MEQESSESLTVESCVSCVCVAYVSGLWYVCGMRVSQVCDTVSGRRQSGWLGGLWL
jgi:hypothetical protein